MVYQIILGALECPGGNDKMAKEKVGPGAVEDFVCEIDLIRPERRCWEVGMREREGIG